MKKIPLIKPVINAHHLKKAVDDIAKTGILTKGKYLHAFEAKLQKHLDIKYAFATTSCTTALHLALVALDIKNDDEVLVADFSFPATANVVVQVGAKPVFVDINLSNYCINIEDLKKKITRRSKAIIVVHAFGYPADMSTIMKIARQHRLLVIEDAACAIGSKHKNKFCGTWGDIGCFSFHPRKVLTTGEGGAIVSNNSKFVKRIEILRNHGSIIKEDGSLSFVEAGFNYRMSELQAAMGEEQVTHLSSTIKKRQKLAQQYIRLLDVICDIQLPYPPKNGISNYQSFVILLPKRINRNMIIRKMAKYGIETTLGTYALHAQTAYRRYGYYPGKLNNSNQAYEQTLTLPLYSTMSVQDIRYIVKCLQVEINNI